MICLNLCVSGLRHAPAFGISDSIGERLGSFHCDARGACVGQSSFVGCRGGDPLGTDGALSSMQAQRCSTHCLCCVFHGNSSLRCSEQERLDFNSGGWQCGDFCSLSSMSSESPSPQVLAAGAWCLAHLSPIIEILEMLHILRGDKGEWNSFSALKQLAVQWCSCSTHLYSHIHPPCQETSDSVGMGGTYEPRRVNQG